MIFRVSCLALVLAVSPLCAQPVGDAAAEGKGKELEKFEPVEASKQKFPERTISNSNQFILYGSDKRTRLALANRSEEIRRDFAAVLGVPTSWDYRIVMILREPRESVATNRRVIGKVEPVDPQSFRFQIDILQDDRFEMEEFEAELVKMLILEQMYSPWNAKISQGRVPPWIQVGIQQLIDFRRAGRSSDIYDSLTQANQILTVEEVMNTNPQLLHDTLSRQVFRACAGALVQAMLDQTNGSERFLVMLRDLAVDGGSELELMKRHYTTFRQNEKALSKWWLLQMALMSQRSIFEVLTVAESERFLEQAIRVYLPPSEEEQEEKPSRFPSFRRKEAKEPEFTTGTLRDYKLFIEDPRAEEALGVCMEQLLTLRDQVSPLHRPVVVGYLGVVGKLSEGETKGVGEVLGQLDSMRAEIRTIMTGVRDYMNWYSVTQLDEETDAFEGYENALKRLDGLSARKRTDPVSKYLDDFEKELAR